MAVPSESSLPTPELNTPVVEQWCCSRLKVDTFTYTWAIKYFSLRYEEHNVCIKSSEFTASSNEMLKWRLHAYPKGSQQNYGYFSLFLVLATDNDERVWATFKLAILNDKQEEAIKWQSKEPHRFSKGSMSGNGKFIKRDFILDEANGLLPGDTLTIFCEVSVVSDNDNLSGKFNTVQYKMPECRLSEDLGSLLENRRFSDVTLSVRGKTFQAHKAILAERSPVFAVMFEHDKEERKNNTVNITDIEHEVFKEMLYFIYTGRTMSLENIAQDLLPAADKYALARLKVMCEEALCKSLSVDKAVDILILADRHSADQLKAQAVNYINMHAADVMQTQAWKTMILSHPHLFAEVFSVMAKQHLLLGGGQ